MESTSPCGATLCPDLALMQLRKQAADGESESQAIAFARQARIDLIKAFKDAFQMLFRNAHPIITDA